MQPDILKPAIRQQAVVASTNPNDSLATALMDDTVVTMDSASVYMGQPHSVDVPAIRKRVTLERGRIKR